MQPIIGCSLLSFCVELKKIHAEGIYTYNSVNINYIYLRLL